MRNIFFAIIILLQILYVNAQTVEVIGDFKINTIPEANSSNDVLVKAGNGIISKRDATTLGVPMTGIIMSQIENNSQLINSGFSKIGFINLPFHQAPSHSEPDTFITINNFEAPTSRTGHTAIWTGEEMIIWGGDLDGDEINITNTGGRYNPQSDSWVDMSTTGAPSPRFNHTAIWTGEEMIVWGGRNQSSLLNNGAKYDPLTDTWTPVTLTSNPGSRWGHTAVWTGSDMIIWGGNTSLLDFTPTNTGAKYNPNTDSWTSMSSPALPRLLHTSLWNGFEMIVWGLFNTGAKYNYDLNTWSNITSTGAPSPRVKHTAVWSGSQMIVWGGFDSGNSSSVYNDGATYNPGTNTWTPISLTNAPTARYGHTAIWSGTEMIVWGGESSSVKFNTGSRYVPNTNTWISTTLTNAPDARTNHTAIWTGTEKIIWGGINGLTFNSGAKYSIFTEEYLPPSNINFYLYKKN